MAGARDGQLRIHRGSDDPPWTITLYDDEAGQERLPLGRISIEEWLARREEAIEMRWAGEFNPTSQYFTGDVVRVRGPQYVCLAPPAARLDTRVDTFVRADQAGWGTASDGNLWTQQASPTPGLEAIAGNTGTASSSAGSAVNGNRLGAPMASSNAELLVRWAVTTSVDGTDGVQLSLATQLGTELYAGILLNGTIIARSTVAGVSDDDHEVPAGWAGGAAGTLYWSRFRHDDGTYTIRTWADGTSEPALADLEWSSGRASPPGYLGLLNVDSNALTTVSFDSLDARMLRLELPYPALDGEHWQLAAG